MHEIHSNSFEPLWTWHSDQHPSRLSSFKQLTLMSSGNSLIWLVVCVCRLQIAEQTFMQPRPDYPATVPDASYNEAGEHDLTLQSSEFKRNLAGLVEWVFLEYPSFRSS